MPRTPRESASGGGDFGAVVDRAEELDGYSVNFVEFREDIDATPLFKGLPDDRCQCPHWGYVIRGQVRVLYADHEETLRAGDAYYLAPGHTTVFEADTEMIEFSPAGEYQKTMEVAIRNVTGAAV